MVRHILVCVFIFVGLMMTDINSDSIAGAISIHMVEERGITAARALQKSTNSDDMECRSVRVMAPKSGFIIECHFLPHEKSIEIQWWMAYAIDGKLTALAPLNSAAQSVAPPNGTSLKPWSNSNFARLIELESADRAEALEAAKKTFENLKR